MYDNNRQKRVWFYRFVWSMFVRIHNRNVNIHLLAIKIQETYMSVYIHIDTIPILISLYSTTCLQWRFKNLKKKKPRWSIHFVSFWQFFIHLLCVHTQNINETRKYLYFKMTKQILRGHKFAGAVIGTLHT